jgi:hypothetical protein
MLVVLFIYHSKHIWNNDFKSLFLYIHELQRKKIFEANNLYLSAKTSYEF